uniref:Uncharacterized protein n=1 Tax=Heterorhabditis bacteriophora TaxID=37862 RepID=A0A1I7WPZ5_HETBA
MDFDVRMMKYWENHYIATLRRGRMSKYFILLKKFASILY